MGFFKKKSIKDKAVAGFEDREVWQPVIQCSICTGEQRAGFVDKRNGEFRELMLINDPGDLKEFMKMYDIRDIKKIY